MLSRKLWTMAVSLPFILSGCGNAFTPAAPLSGDVRIANQVHPIYENNLIPQSTNTANPDLAPSQDPLTAGGDPLTGSDPLAGSTTLAGGDPLTRDTSTASDDTNREIKNWYWLKGTIANGAVTVTVNGIAVGRYAVTVDKEISDYVHPGSNDVTFLCQPTVSDQPVDADLNVIYSQQAEGAPPVLTFNTATDIPPPAAAQPQQFGKPGAPIPGLPLPSADPEITSDGSTTTTVSFIAS